ncbi:uncharacterized protein LOC116013129 [Ipomoea triloba]|uniref:uncharacterized protein LOC116013129 n=1 Tax=Ipomoea triloba TaxID=35885 RepID=UPI00125D1E85|nr:uncharacterized protein LOC116013129 [Ipomoea triloba]
MWKVISTRLIEIFKDNAEFVLSPDAPQYVQQPKSEWTSEDRIRNNLGNIANDIIFKAIDDTIIPKIRKCTTTKEIWETLIKIGEGDEQEKDNKLIIAMKKFEDFNMLSNESILDMEARIINILGEINDLGKIISQKEINLKVLRGLPSAWDMKVTAMRDHRDLRMLSTEKLFSDLKAYEFEMKAKVEEEDHEVRNSTLMAEPSTSRKFKKFMRGGTGNSSCGNQNATTWKLREENEDENKDLCYNCRKPRHFKINCLYPIVSKHQGKKIIEFSQNKPESKERRFKRDKRKALVSNEPNEDEELDEASSSDEILSSENNTTLVCLVSKSMELSSNEDCLMTLGAEDEEVTSNSFDSISSSFSRESIVNLMRDYQECMTTQSQLKERNDILILEKKKK